MRVYVPSNREGREASTRGVRDGRRAVGTKSFFLASTVLPLRSPLWHICSIFPPFSLSLLLLFLSSIFPSSLGDISWL